MWFICIFQINEIKKQKKNMVQKNCKSIKKAIKIHQKMHAVIYLFIISYMETRRIRSL